MCCYFVGICLFFVVQQILPTTVNVFWIFLVTDSLMYASALKFYSIPLSMSGRFVSGLGALCGVNIRYIASVHRTVVSAIYMSISAVGMSMGP